MVADGPLHGLPFSTLRDPVSKQLLVERVATMMSPSLQYAMERGSNAPCTGCINLVVGNPAQSTVANGPSERPVLRRRGRGGRGTLLRRHTRQRRRRHARPPASHPAVSADAASPVTRSRMKAVPICRGSWWRRRRPTSKAPYSASDIEKLKLSARLAVLAACDTATGAVRPGAGMFGLARAFLTAGVPIVAATLWPVADREASMFFADFHRQLAQGLKPARALRAAQLQSRRAGRNAASGVPLLPLDEQLHR